MSYDARGNLTDDGVQWAFDYDGNNRLERVFRREGSVGAAGSRGRLFAKFSYDALGRLAAAVYDLDPIDAATGAAEQTDEVFADEVIEYRGYDDRSRLVCVWKQNLPGTLDPYTQQPTSPGVRPPPAISERIIHRMNGRAMSGEGWFLDSPVWSQINTDWTTDPGEEFEITRHYLQSSVTGDIAGVFEMDEATGITRVERLAYSMFGIPRLEPTSGVPGDPVGCDLDDDGDLATGLHADGVVDINDLLAFLAGFEVGDVLVDIDDGTFLGLTDDTIDINDLLYVLEHFEAAWRGDASDNRYAWRGYQWDPHLGLYHVRNRVFNPSLCTWMQEDPLGEVDGPNPYAYVGWDPFNKYDPLGLAAGEPEYWIMREHGAYVVVWTKPVTIWHPFSPNEVVYTAPVVLRGSDELPDHSQTAQEYINAHRRQEAPGAYDQSTQEVAQITYRFGNEALEQAKQAAIDSVHNGALQVVTTVAVAAAVLHEAMSFAQRGSRVARTEQQLAAAGAKKAESACDEVSTSSRGLGNVGGGATTAENALSMGEKWLGKGYREVAPGVYRSADGRRQFRMTTSDLTDPRQGPHVHFETVGPDGRVITENSHVTITDP